MAKKVQRAWFTEIKDGDTVLALVEKTSRTIDGVTDEWQAVTESGLQIVVEYVGTDADLTGTTSEWGDISDRYHQSIVDKVISIGYRDMRNSDLKNAEYFEAQYLKGEKRAKKMARSHYYEGSGRIVPQDF
tara:strand:- start:913 stop:1305 length:393 start_codon:yes stop_codon:yes gene_type:complete